MSEEFDLRQLLETVFSGRELSREQAREVMGRLMDGELSHVQAAALLAGLRTKGESVEEVVGFAQAMRDRSVKVPVAPGGPLLDTCGTGGTGLRTFNVSTTATFIAVAAGARVAKHGNVGATRLSGTADVLQAAGVRLDLTPAMLAESLRTVGMAFLFARNHHPAMRFVAPVRAELKARTVFNILGPLTNPAGADHQLLGVFAPELTEPIAGVLRGLGVKRALVVHGDGLDDFTVTGPTKVTELASDGTITSYKVHPEDVALKSYQTEELAGSDPASNAAILAAVLGNELGGAKRDIALFNAGAALYLAGLAVDIAEGVRLARANLEDGSAARKLEQFVQFTQQAAPGGT